MTPKKKKKKNRDGYKFLEGFISKKKSKVE